MIGRRKLAFASLRTVHGARDKIASTARPVRVRAARGEIEAHIQHTSCVLDLLRRRVAFSASSCAAWRRIREAGGCVVV